MRRVTPSERLAINGIRDRNDFNFVHDIHVAQGTFLRVDVSNHRRRAKQRLCSSCGDRIKGGVVTAPGVVVAAQRVVGNRCLGCMVAVGAES